MKAYFEFEMPGSCSECILSGYDEDEAADFCKYYAKEYWEDCNSYIIGDYHDRRAPFCPLANQGKMRALR